MFKKHKFKFLALLILFVLAGGGAAYYFKKKEADKKAAKMEEKEASEEQPKEPLVVAPSPDKSTEKPTEKAKTKEMVVSKGDKQLLAKSK